jgi:hypothetical protein
MLYANSSDGVEWEKPDQDNGVCYVPGQHTNTKAQHSADHFNCSRPGATATIAMGESVIYKKCPSDCTDGTTNERVNVLKDTYVRS